MESRAVDAHASQHERRTCTRRLPQPSRHRGACASSNRPERRERFGAHADATETAEILVHERAARRCLRVVVTHAIRSAPAAMCSTLRDAP